MMNCPRDYRSMTQSPTASFLSILLALDTLSYPSISLLIPLLLLSSHPFPPLAPQTVVRPLTTTCPNVHSPVAASTLSPIGNGFCVFNALGKLLPANTMLARSRTVGLAVRDTVAAEGVEGAYTTAGHERGDGAGADVAGDAAAGGEGRE